MKSFQYVSPRSVDTAISLATDNGRFLAGGIDILGEMKDYIASPRLLVNVKDLPGYPRYYTRERFLDDWHERHHFRNRTASRIETCFPRLATGRSGSRFTADS